MLHHVIDTISLFLYQHRYIFAFLGALLEGNVIMLLGGFLYKLGIFKFWGVIPVLITGYALNGYGWYVIGRLSGRRILEKWGPYFFLTKERLRKLERYFKKNTEITLIVSRITFGVSMYVFMIAGAFRTKAKKFFWCNLVATLIWVSTLFGIGYGFGASYQALNKVVKVIAVWLLIVFFITVVLIVIGFVYWLRRKDKIKFIEKVINQGCWIKLKLLVKKIGKFLTKN